MHRYDRESWAMAMWRQMAAPLWTERQLIMRSDGRVRTIALPRSAQAMALLGGLGIAAWFSYATAIYFDFDDPIAGRDRVTHNAYRGPVDAGDKLQMLSETLQQKHAVLARALEQNEMLHAELQAAIGDRTKAEQERDGLAGRISDLEGRLAQVPALNEAAVRQMADTTRKDIEAAEKLLAQVGISPNLVAKKPPRGVGGPFIPARPGDSADPFGKSITTLLANLERRDNLNGMINSLPIGAPLARYTIGSNFGRRIDPFNGSAAFHQGIDLTAEKKTPVHSPAGGTVVTATTDSRLGRLVEIDHGHNLVTRYGHLSAGNVKVGQKVARGDVLGFVGSTGRATGPHLHYEVLVNGQPVDPMRFMKAAKHVQKG
jgi:murein DD-endopeptidase MepM/ murein hydrolase activator NlpD